jgi:HEAT repeat protein
MHRPETIDSLMQVIHDANPEIRTITLESLSNFSESNLIPIFLMALQDKVAKVRREAVIALGLRANQETEYDLVKHLKPLLSDPYPEVCQQAAIALGRMGTNEAAEALFHVLKSPATPPWLKLEMVRALSRIETVQALDYLQEGLRWASTEVCQEIIKVLGTRLTPSLRAKATKILIDFCHSGQSAVNLTPIKQVLATSLGELGEPEAVVTLQKLATDAEATVRLHALAALKKIPQLR